MYINFTEVRKTNEQASSAVINTLGMRPPVNFRINTEMKLCFSVVRLLLRQHQDAGYLCTSKRLSTHENPFVRLGNTGF